MKFEVLVPLVEEDMSTINDYSYTSFYVDLMYNDQKITNATCFFSKRRGEVYLITNWHVVSGKNADTGECLDKWARIPDKLRVYMPKLQENEEVCYSSENYMDVQLYDEAGNKLWFEKRVGDRWIDVAVISCKNIDDYFYLPIEEAEEIFNENTKCFIALEIYIIGFPFGNNYGYMPIWKKASVASEPEVDIEGVPYFFADTATKDGMSGSPVILYEKRFNPVVDKERRLTLHKTKFIGIYSGRIGANAFTRNDAQLGRVWKERVIQEILDENE